jgi:hypothetical protein
MTICFCFITEFHSLIRVPQRPIKAVPSEIQQNDEILVNYWLVAWASVDQLWGSSPTNGAPKTTPPKSYLAKARSDQAWREMQHEANPVLGGGQPRQIHGRMVWPSDPIKVSVRYKQVDQVKYEILKVDIVSSVFNCAWWKRNKL